MKQWIAYTALIWVFMHQKPFIWKLQMAWEGRKLMPWWTWLFLWPVVSVILAPIVGKYLRWKRERMERLSLEYQDEGQRWKSPKDEEWRERW